MSKIKTTKGDFYFFQKTLFVGSKQIDKKIALENLLLLNNLFNQSQLNYGVAFGTLLGIIRDNDFIQWDEDMDLYILKENEELFKEQLWGLKSIGFELIRYEKMGLYSIQRKGEYIDIYILKSLTPNVRHTGGADFILEKYVKNTRKWNFKGIELNVPEEYEECLEFMYGDWKTPVKYANFEMNCFKKALVKFTYVLKRNLPDFLYFYLINIYHKKDFAKFKEKCQTKGIEI